jgi:hypothetical protein
MGTCMLLQVLDITLHDWWQTVATKRKIERIAEVGEFSYLREVSKLAYAAYVNLLRCNKDTIQKNAETSMDASKEGGLEINIEKTK